MAGQMSIPVNLDRFIISKTYWISGPNHSEQTILLYSILMDVIKLTGKSCVSLLVCRDLQDFYDDLKYRGFINICFH